MFVGEGILYDAMHARHESVIILTMCSSSLFSQYVPGLRGGAPHLGTTTERASSLIFYCFFKYCISSLQIRAKKKFEK